MKPMYAIWESKDLSLFSVFNTAREDFSQLLKQLKIRCDPKFEPSIFFQDGSRFLKWFVLILCKWHMPSFQELLIHYWIFKPQCFLSQNWVELPSIHYSWYWSWCNSYGIYSFNHSFFFIVFWKIQFSGNKSIWNNYNTDIFDERNMVLQNGFAL